MPITNSNVPITSNGDYFFECLQPGGRFILRVSGAFGGGTVTPGFDDGLGNFVAYRDSLGAVISSTVATGWRFDIPDSAVMGLRVTGATAPNIRIGLTPSNSSMSESANLAKMLVTGQDLGSGVATALAKPVGTAGSVQLYGDPVAAAPGVFPVNSSEIQWPLTGQLYALGDSQTWGANAQAVDMSGAPITAASRIFEPYRWTTLFAAAEGRSLTVNNLGRPGQKISDPPGFAEPSVWHGWGLVPQAWTGVTTMMLGYNNLAATPLDGYFFSVMERAYSAFVARALVENYAGIGVTGIGATGATQDAFSTTGTGAAIAVPAGESNQRTAFYYGSPNGATLTVVLTTGQYVQFTATDKKAIGLFLRSSPTGGGYSVTVNGTEVIIGSSVYNNVGGGDQAQWQYPLVEWLENLPASAVIRLTATSGNVIWQAYGSIPKTGSIAQSRRIVLAGPTGNQANSRSDAMLQELNHRARTVAQKYDSYGVFLADTYSNWDSLKNDQVGDESHFTVAGNQRVAEAFSRAGRSRRAVTAAPVSEATFTTWLDHVNFANLDPATWGVNLTQNGGQLGTPNSVIQVRCGPAANSTIIVNESSAGGTSSMVRPTHVMPVRIGSYIDWSLPFRASFTLIPANQTATGVGYINFATLYNNSVFGPLVRKGFGLKLTNNILQAQLFGTALTTSPTLETVNPDVAYQIVIEHIGGGNYEFSLNGSKRWTSNAGPTGLGFQNCNGVEISGTNGASTNYYLYTVNNLRVMHTPITTRY